jgi:hypothetical protein
MPDDIAGADFNIPLCEYQLRGARLESAGREIHVSVFGGAEGKEDSHPVDIVDIACSGLEREAQIHYEDMPPWPKPP